MFLPFGKASNGFSQMLRGRSPAFMRSNGRRRICAIATELALLRRADEKTDFAMPYP